eukprot:gb/GEZJ01000303.1/.p2 GENE.gb/GEZJ01000303.1/~~gb/GEZJ01000303.1/.p2  ORF type:complete len:138 (+),score=4.15 gb/GEZJ01000303.1/:635-1048(+)
MAEVHRVRQPICGFFDILACTGGYRWSNLANLEIRRTCNCTRSQPYNFALKWLQRSLATEQIKLRPTSTLVPTVEKDQAASAEPAPATALFTLPTALGKGTNEAATLASAGCCCCCCTVFSLSTRADAPRGHQNSFN